MGKVSELFQSNKGQNEEQEGKGTISFSGGSHNNTKQSDRTKSVARNNRKSNQERLGIQSNSWFRFISQVASGCLEVL